MAPKQRLSRAQMEQEIIQGRSVVFGGRTYSRVQDLPTEAQLAQGDPVAEQQVVNSLKDQIAALQAQVERLTAVQPPSGGEPQPQGQSETGGTKAKVSKTEKP